METQGRRVTTLSTLVAGRDNNFDLIRLIAAFSVLVSHGAFLSGHSFGWMPLPGPFGVGVIAVNVFFVTSGFLVTASLFNRADLVAFATSRLLRIFPALWVMLLLTVLVLGPALTTVDLHAWFTSPVTYDYLRHQAILGFGFRDRLPGLFETNPFPGGVNGSLWTLPIELRLYKYLAIGWALVGWHPRLRYPAFRIVLPIAALVPLWSVLSHLFSEKTVFGSDELIAVNIFMFFYGACLYTWRDKVIISPKAMWLFLGVLLVSAPFPRASGLAYMATLAPLIVHLAFLPKGPIRAFNAVGDYSYGLYIYAFPIQQALVFKYPDIKLWQMIAASSVLTFIPAALSWHFLEKPILARKESVAATVQRAIDSVVIKLRDARTSLKARTSSLSP